MSTTGCRVTVIAHELRGFLPVGGMGTATTFLALALARMGHSVEILLGKHALESIDPTWEAMYRNAGVSIRPAPQSDEPVEPWRFSYAHNVTLGLQAKPTDVVIAHDFGAPVYSALRLRQAGIAFEESLFVVFCHGTRRYVADLSPGIPFGDLETVLGIGMLEQACIELADVVVSPSAYLLDWMRGRGWALPERSLVIPYFTRSDAIGEAVPVAPRPTPDPVRRLAFFGRVDEKKGLRPFAAALNALEPERLRGLEVDFVGRTTRTWTRERTEALFSKSTRRSLARLEFQTELDQQEALAWLSRPGTLVVMPSLQENSPNTIYECLEHGIPFIASNVGGVPELIAPADRARVLFEPTPEGVEAVLRRVLEERVVPAPTRPAFEPSNSFERWANVLTMQPDGRPIVERVGDERIDVVVVRCGSPNVLSPCLSSLEQQTYRNFDVTVATSREEGLRNGSAPYVVFLEEEDVPDDDLLSTLIQTRRTTQADVVTCGLRLVDDRGDRMLHFFSGEPAGLGAVGNQYGNVALLSRERLGDFTDLQPPPRDQDWPLLAGLAGSGARIVSVPVALVERRTHPGTVEDDPVGALVVIRQLEHALPEPLAGAARLAAGLAMAQRS